MSLVAILVFALSLIPAILWTVNLFWFHAPGEETEQGEDCSGDLPSVSVLIPARNEENRLDETLMKIRENQGVDMEILVYDDHSEDRTPEIIRKHARKDERIKFLQGDALPDGWCGKQFACWNLANSASNDILCFVDADVRLAPDAVKKILIEFCNQKASLISGFPRQIAESPGEKMLLPFIHYILLCFLPLWLMRHTTNPVFSAGCGQLMIVDREVYEEVGGHRSIRESRHDGIALPAVFRKHGYRTDLFDGRNIATVRMYEGFAETWRGFAKNATEGMARPLVLPVFTLFLLGGQVFSYILLFIALGFNPGSLITIFAGAAVLASCLPRLHGAFLFHQSLLSALLHPLGVLLLLANQWYALASSRFGGRFVWKGRSYSG